jgi:Asp-tRNA(Asn)/Glu-tRNA(Gln) amidotransferase A subunit family amidase
LPAPDLLTGLDTEVESLRLAWSPDFGRVPVDGRIVVAGRAALVGIEAAGARVEEVSTRIEHPWGDGLLQADRQAAVAAGIWNLDDPSDIPETNDEQPWMWEVFASQTPLTATAAFRSLCERNVHLLTPPTQLTYQGSAPPIGETAQEPTLEELKASIDAVLATHDVICSPTMSTVAPLAPPGWGTPYADPYMGTNFTFIANTTGCPAASIPSGLVDGLPVGLQVIGRPGDEATLLRVCYALVAAAPELPRPTAIAQPAP